MVSRISCVPDGARVGHKTQVPCGRCLGCRTKQARDWAIRLTHESLVRRDAWYITLTYEKAPERGSLEPVEFQKWLKRLRRRHLGRLSYYGCGEYGDATDRPHYHAVILGDQVFRDREEIGRRGPYKVYRSELLEKTWSKGFTELQAMSYGAAAYVAGYVRKKISKLDSEDHYSRYVPETGELVEVEPEFSRMSRRPAIGKDWIRQNWRDVYPRDFIPMNGREFGVPRFYDKWMDGDHSEEEVPCDSCDEHREVMHAVRDKRWEDRYEFSRYELDSMESAHKSRVSLFSSRDAI